MALLNRLFVISVDGFIQFLKSDRQSSCGYRISDEQMEDFPSDDSLCVDSEYKYSSGRYFYHRDGALPAFYDGDDFAREKNGRTIFQTWPA